MRIYIIVISFLFTLNVPFRLYHLLIKREYPHPTTTIHYPGCEFVILLSDLAIAIVGFKIIGWL